MHRYVLAIFTLLITSMPYGYGGGVQFLPSTIAGDSALRIIPLTVDCLYPQSESNASQPRVHVLDEVEKGGNHTSDLQKPSFSTYWSINPWSKTTTPYHYIIDLHTSYKVDNLCIATDQAVKLNVYILNDLNEGSEWEKVLNEVKTAGWTGNQQWTKLPLSGKHGRFIRLSFECLDYKPSGGGVVRYTDINGGKETSNTPGSKGFTTATTASINPTVPRIWEMVAYGTPVNAGRPSGIRKPLRRTVKHPTVDGFISANDQGYHQGRLSSLYANEYVRQYMSSANHTITEVNGFRQPGNDGGNMKKNAVHWATPHYSEADVRATRFGLDKIPWVMNNSGLRDADGERTIGWGETLNRTYKKHGLRPFCTPIAPLAQTAIYYKNWKENFTAHRYMDKYFTEEYDSMPVPSIAYQGWEKYFAETQNPLNYKMISKLAFSMARKYGNKAEDGSLDVHNYLWDAEDMCTGRDLMSGMEFFNEPDNTWTGFGGYLQPLEFAAIQSAVYDGHSGALAGTSPNWYGVKNADPDFLSIAPGFITLSPGYLLQAYIWWCTHRPPGRELPLDVLNTHAYFSNGGNQDLSTSFPNLKGCTVEYTVNNQTNPALTNLPRMRDMYMPDKPIWITEMGWGEAGLFGVPEGNLKSQFQVRSLPPGTYDNAPARTTPPRFRGDLKGQYFIRSVISLMDLGYDMCHWYMTENEDNWFDTSKWSAGAGWEMFYWDKDAKGNPVPDARKLAHNASYVKPHGAPKFAGMGLFGNVLHNGGYPISRAFWFVKTFRERFAGYSFVGFKKPASGSDDGRIRIACFRKEDNSGKGAYVVYYLNPEECTEDIALLNRGRAAVKISLPAGVQHVTHVKTYIPDIPNPKALDLPAHPEYIDRARSGLPTSRYERWNGTKWEITNPRYQEEGVLKSYSHTDQPAVYPKNPALGQEITVLPTKEENPFFPLVGPVGDASIQTSSGQEIVTARQYQKEGELQYDPTLAWRQVDALCDFIELAPEGLHGCRGNERLLTAVSGMLTADVTEEPEYYFFDAEPDAEYTGTVENTCAIPLSPTSVKLWWNNTDARDTGYQVYISQSPEAPTYTLFNNGEIFTTGEENNAVLTGLKPDTDYYFRVLPLSGKTSGLPGTPFMLRTPPLLPGR